MPGTAPVVLRNRASRSAAQRTHMVWRVLVLRASTPGTIRTPPVQRGASDHTTEFCAPRIRQDSIHALLHRERLALFPDALFSDLFADVGRRSVPALVVAVVMVLQRLDGLSDREAVERFTFDARWKYAAGGLPFDHPGFAHTVLVDMRARLARSERPNRIFERTLEVARAAGLVGVRRVLDSTPPCTTPSPRWTPSASSAARSGACSPSRVTGKPSSDRSSAGTMTTGPAASPPATGRTRMHGRRSSTRSPAMGKPCSRRSSQLSPN